MTVSRETRNYRRDAVKAYKRAGNKFLIRRAYTLWDLDDGITDRCPVCYHEGYSNATDSHCPVCFGTGFNNGYHPTELVWGVVDYNISNENNNDAQGFTDTYDMSFKCSYPPFINDGDLLAPIISDDPFMLDQIMEIDKPVSAKTLVGWVSDNHNSTVNQKDSIIGQSGKIVFEYLDDIRNTPEFWKYEGKYPILNSKPSTRAAE